MMTRTMMFRLLAPLVLLSAACQHVPPATLPTQQPGHLVGRQELIGSRRTMLFEALRVVRPNYFNTRGPTTLLEQGMPAMIVIVDGLVYPDLESLRMTPVTEVVQVRRLSVAETYHRYNRSVSAGALEITLRKP
jgi:hypothetical protein